MNEGDKWIARAEETERNIVEAAEAIMEQAKGSNVHAAIPANAAALLDLATAVRQTMETRAIRMKIAKCKCDLLPAGQAAASGEG